MSSIERLTGKLMSNRRAAFIARHLPDQPYDAQWLAETYLYKCSFADNESESWRLAIEWALRTMVSVYFDSAEVREALDKMERAKEFRDNQSRKQARKQRRNQK